MFVIDNTTVIYVLCPANKKTGGTELAHQLVKELNNNGLCAYITYYYKERFKNPINEAFLEYVDQCKEISDIEDRDRNILIVPEINFDFLENFLYIQKAIWWMSVDNYVKNDGFLGACSISGGVAAIKSLFKGRISLFKKGFDRKVLHLYQSEYAHQFLLKQGVTRLFRLSDYVNDSYLCGLEIEKENIVLYNPKKGYHFTKKIIEASAGLNWMPIENMTTEQVKGLLSKSKVYIDFGNHPGKDRFPREAAISGCCVITGRSGSAAYYEDIPIPDRYKFDQSVKHIFQIISQIQSCLDNYEEEICNFMEYRNMIIQEHEIFIMDVKKLFALDYR